MLHIIKKYLPHKDVLQYPSISTTQKTIEPRKNKLVDPVIVNVIRSINPEQFKEALDAFDKNYDVFKKHTALYNIDNMHGDSEKDIPAFCKFLSEHPDFAKLNFAQITLLIAYASNYSDNYPISGLDFASLYPSIIICFNMCPSTACKNEQHAQLMESKGYKVHRTKFTFKQKLITSYFVRHTYESHMDPDAKAKETNLGLYPRILIKLKNLRAELKKPLKHYAHMKEKLSAEGKDFINGEETEEYSNVCFEWNKLDSKQKAIKVLMNTFYGEAGNQISPLYKLELANSVTTMGQINIKSVRHIALCMNMKAVYGDTDSMYLACPKYLFKEVEHAYETGKITVLEYSTKLVEITFIAMKEINRIVNDYLINLNGNNFLSMAYEEVLFPVAFLAKKNYYGIAHEGIVNFKPNELFIRGVSVIKRGTSNLLRKVGMEIMWDSMDLNNFKAMRSLVEEKIDEIFNRKWDIKDFEIIGQYKPDKQNVCMHTFAQRMIEHPECKPPKPYDIFSYVIVKKYPFNYDNQGRIIHLKKGDIIEYMDFAEKNKLEIDMKAYMEAGITKQFARYLSGCSVNELPEIYKEFNTKEEVTQDYWTGRNEKGICVVFGLDDNYDNKIIENDAENLDKMRIDSQTKYLDGYMAKYIDEFSQKGNLYKGVYKLCNSVMKNTVKITELELLKKKSTEHTKNYAFKFLNSYLQLKKKKVTTFAIINELYKGINLTYNAKIKHLQKIEREIIKEIENHNFYISDINQKKSTVVEKFNKKIKELLNLDKMYLEKNAEVPSFNELINKLDLDTYNVYLKYQQELIDEVKSIDNSDTNVHYKMLLNKLESVYNVQNNLINIKRYLVDKLSNKPPQSNVDIDDLAAKLAVGNV